MAALDHAVFPHRTSTSLVSRLGCRRFLHAPEFSQHFRDHAGGGNIGDAAQQDSSERSPSEEETRCEVSAKSITPAVTPSRRLFFNSSPVYSSPNQKQKTPISAPVRTKFSLSLRGARPPLPKARPAKRYRGIAEKPQRLASLAKTARPTMTRPSSMNTYDTSCRW